MWQLEAEVMNWQRVWAIVVVVAGLGGSALALSGSGTEQDPWRIQSLADFDEFVSDANYFILRFWHLTLTP